MVVEILTMLDPEHAVQRCSGAAMQDAGSPWNPDGTNRSRRERGFLRNPGSAPQWREHRSTVPAQLAEVEDGMGRWTSLTCPVSRGVPFRGVALSRAGRVIVTLS